MENQKISAVEMLAKAEEYKIKGNEFFKNGDIQKAIKKYHFSLMHTRGLEKPLTLTGIPGTETHKKLNEDEKKKLESLKCQCHNNLAACFMKKKQYEKVVEYSSKVLETDATNIKALFRRGEAYFSLKNIDKSELDFKEIKQIDPKETCVDRYFALIETEKKKQVQREKEIYKKMMNRAET